MKKLIVILTILVTSSALAKKDVHVLFLGNTGTGKSSLINIFYNHVKGKKYEDTRDIVIPLLDRSKKYLVNVDAYKNYGVKLNENGDSQTIQVREYKVENDFYVVHLWDAPGFNDTNGQVTDEEHIQKIVTAIGDTSIHAIAVVMKADELDRNGAELKVNVNRIRTMLPKTAAKNIVGIFNRAGSLSKSGKASLKRDFAKLFEMTSRDVDPDVYAIDGISFFDEDEGELGEAKWAADRWVVEKILADISQKEPVSGKDAREIQDLVTGIETKIIARSGDLETLDKLVMDLALLENELQHSEKKREENKDYEKEKELTIEQDRVEIDRRWGFLWEIDRRIVKDKYTGVAKYTDEVQLQHYKDALAKVESTRAQIEITRKSKEDLSERANRVMKEILGLQVKREEMAISTNLDPFIQYLEERIRVVKVDKNLSDEARELRVKLLKNRCDVYKKLRRTLDDREL